MADAPRVDWSRAQPATYPPCPFCHAWNNPMASYVEWIDGRFVCAVCGHDFAPPESSPA